MRKKNKFIAMVLTLLLVIYPVLPIMPFLLSEVEASGCGTGDVVNPSDPLIICTAEDFDGIGNNTSGHYRLGADIDLTDWNDGDGWITIETFSGSLDGNNHAISGLNNVLFGEILEGSEIKNLNLSQVSIEGGTFNVGGLVGSNLNDGVIESSSFTGGGVEGTGYGIGGLVGDNEGTIIESHTAVDVLGNIANENNRSIGGLAGSNMGTIENSSSEGSVIGYEIIGGLVGENYLEGSIIQSYSTSYVTGGNIIGGLVAYQTGGSIRNSYGEGDLDGSNDVGGLVGFVEEGLIENSYATGKVSGIQRVGGFIGDNMGTIENAYATGEVIGHTEVGGFVGSNYLGTITNTYATGNVNGNTKVGGLVGSSIEATISQSFALNEQIITTGDLEPVWGRVVGYRDNTQLIGNYSTHDLPIERTSSHDLNDGGDLSFEKVKTIFPYLDNGWDFMYDWKFEEGLDYPILRSEPAPEIMTPSIPSISTSNGTLIEDLEYLLLLCDGNSANLSAVLGANTKFLRWIEDESDYSVDFIDFPVNIEGMYEIEVASETGNTQRYSLAIDYGSSLTIEVTPENGGTVLDVGKDETVLGYAGCYAPSTQVAFMAQYNTGYSFESWEKDGSVIGDAEGIQYVMPIEIEDVTLVANFIPQSEGGEPDPSADAYLDTLLFNHGVIAPGFDPETRGYALILPQNSTSVTFTATPSDPNSTMKIRVNEGMETVLISDEDSEITVQSGDIVTITVIAPDETTEREYIFTVAMEEMRSVNLEIGQSELNWATVIGSKNNWITRPIFVQTTDGGMLAAGTLEPSKVSEEFGYLSFTRVIQLVKTNSLGENQWSKFLPGLGFTSIKDVKETSDGGYIVLGTTSITPTGELSIAHYIYLVRLDANGNIVWEEVLEEELSPQKVLVTTDGGFLILAEEVLIKTNSSGIKETETVIEGVFGKDIKATSDGGYILIGQDNNSKNYLVKTNALGVESWRKALEHQYEDMEIFSVIEDTDGYVFLGVDYWDWPFSGLIGKTNGLGSENSPPEILWSNPIENIYLESSQSLTIGLNSNYYVVGTRLNDSWNDDIVFLEIDRLDGSVIEESPTIFAGSSNHNDLGYSIIQQSNGNFIIGGTTRSYDSTNYMFILNVVGDPPNPLTINLTATPTSSSNQSVTITATVGDEVGVEVVKWESGNQSAAYFATGGTVFINSFTVNTNGTYTVYARNQAGLETVQTITINNIITVGQTMYIDGRSLLIFRDSQTGHFRLYFTGQ